jgi:hypothetical protein
MKRTKRPKFKVGERVRICLEGEIKELKGGIAYVQTVVREGEYNVFRDAVCYLDELRPLTAKERGRDEAQAEGEGGASERS